MSFVVSEAAKTMLTIFSVAIAGYLIGSIHIKGISLSSAGIFLAGLVFGALGAEGSAVLQNIGLLLFVCSVGLSAGPGFFQRLKQNGLSYFVLCLTTAVTGAAVCLVIIKIVGLDGPLTVGVMTGSFTTSPGFAAAKEAVAGDAAAVSRVAVGYGLAYPVGVLCKVLFIQTVPKVLHADMEKERALIAVARPEQEAGRTLRRLDPWGMTSFALTVLLGILLGSIHLPLPGGGSFSLGITGGPLIIGLLLGQLGHIGKLDLQPKSGLLGPLKEFGLVLFFSNAGIEGGHGVLQILAAHGVVLILCALVLVLIPLFAGYFMFRRVLKLPLLNGLGSMTASMTCTPSLAVLIETAGTDDVAAAYATTYPIALILMVILNQFLVKL